MAKWKWVDLVWLIFLLGLALLPPIDEPHKEEILFGIAVLQLMEGQLIEWLPKSGRYCSVLAKIALSTLLLAHTREPVAINSAYYPIYYLPVITAAMEFGTVATLLWTALASAAYCSFLIPALSE
jgi:hypothetical protein